MGWRRQLERMHILYATPLSTSRNDLGAVQAWEETLRSPSDLQRVCGPAGARWKRCRGTSSAVAPCLAGPHARASCPASAMVPAGAGEGTPGSVLLALCVSIRPAPVPSGTRSLGSSSIHTFRCGYHSSNTFSKLPWAEIARWGGRLWQMIREQSKSFFSRFASRRATGTQRKIGSGCALFLFPSPSRHERQVFCNFLNPCSAPWREEKDGL